MGRLTEIDKSTLEYQGWFSHSYGEGKLVVLPLNAPSEHRKESGDEAWVDNYAKAELRYELVFVIREVCFKNAWRTWRRHSVNGTDVKVFPTF